MVACRRARAEAVFWTRQASRARTDVPSRKGENGWTHPFHFVPDASAVALQAKANGDRLNTP
jgi:hypothetical protein